ncbi:MAG: thioredoxin domain-containing protein [Gemmataceae bacterium]
MKLIARVLSFLLLASLLPATNAAGDKEKKHKFTNRLAKETSPYLLLHAHNPTDWYPWGPEAFAKAKKEKKLIFLSIGYSSCFWCHVMERECFNVEEVAKILNEHFVCVKVDREERPDIDQIYMTALSSQGQSGGWPLSMFLLPDARPVVGGTYFPREDRKVEGKTYPGFKSLLKIINDAWKETPDAIEKQADKLSAATLANLNAGRLGVALVDLDRKLTDSVLEELKGEFDPDYGGFGSPTRRFRGPKFPVPSRLQFVLTQSERLKDKKLLDMVTLSLDQMALGGIYDHLGGGFHRYSTERTWTVPHFEKMLYDNAQLIELYARAYTVTKNPLYRRVVEETIAYLEREMVSPEGAFYSSQDAETEEEEGRFYVWSPEELKKAVPDAAARKLLDKVYGTGEAPNFEEKYHILRLAKPLPEIAKDLKLGEEELRKRLEPIKAKLLEERGKRARPLLNRIALTAWSGEMIAGLAEAGRALKEPKYTKLAERAADFVLEKQMTDGRLLRTYGAAPGGKPKAAVAAYLEDYAFLVHGLLTLHEVTGEKRWLESARKLTDVMIAQHGDKKQGGYYFTAQDSEKLFARSKDQYDGAQPSGNSVAARNLVRLWKATGEEKYRAEAEKTFRFFTASLMNNTTGMTEMANALDDYLTEQERRGKKK